MNNLSWREQTHKCKAKGITVIDFPDTMPNQALVFNYSNYILYGGISCTPSTDKYDTKISAHNSGFIGRPNGFKSFMIYNPNTVDIDVRVYSVFDTFDISNYQRDINDAENLNVSVSEIKGALPSGNNLIGNVNIQNPLPAGGNNLGKIELVGVALDYLSKLESIRALTEGNNTALVSYNSKLSEICSFISSINTNTVNLKTLSENILTKNVNIIDLLAQILSETKNYTLGIKNFNNAITPITFDIPENAKYAEISLTNDSETEPLIIALNALNNKRYVLNPRESITNFKLSLFVTNTDIASTLNIGSSVNMNCKGYVSFYKEV